MFKIIQIDLFDYKNNSYTYNFESGINYFIGKNNSGKTEFYKFIDYMFGASIQIKNSVWYRGSLKKATMIFSYNLITYRITRVVSDDRCYFSYFDEAEGDPINILEYKDRLQAVFCIDPKSLEQLHRFTDEKLTYRSFTLFNFLGEIRQGVLVDFFDKCNDINYSTKITPILNFIFNKNVERIFWLKNQIVQLQQEINKKEEIDNNNKTIIYKVNTNLHKLNTNLTFNGFNGDSILSELMSMSEYLEQSKPMSTKNLSDLEILYSNITEQIKVYEKYKSDLQNQKYENKNREKILEVFKSIISDNEEFKYLVEPLIELTDEIKNSISFSQYLIKDDVLIKLKAQQEKVKDEIIKAKMQLTRFSNDDKVKAIAIAEDGIKCFVSESSIDEINALRDKLRTYRNELKDLQNSNDVVKINYVSQHITNLYKTAYGTSDFVKEDFDKTNNKFHINYIKSRNSLQTMTFDDKGEEIVHGTGSHARHTLIQLCGYLVFIKMLIKENKYPLIPMIVIDHISKPFSNQNVSAIGTILQAAYEEIDVNDLQIIIFDDKTPDTLNIKPNHTENLYDETKTGFNPFFNSSHFET